MTFSRRTLSVATVVLLLAVLAGMAYVKTQGEGEGEDAEAAVEVPEGQGAPSVSATERFSTEVAQPVRATRAVRDTLWLSVTAAGEAEARRRAVMRARVEGRIVSVEARENDRVEAGDVLLRFDTTEFALERDRAVADRSQAEAQYRELVLFDDELEDPEVRAERDRFARARSGLEQAEVGLREAELDLERAIVRAPFAGRVADLRVVEGGYAAVGDELVTVVELDPIRVEARVLESELPSLEEGRAASVRFAALPGETFRGRVETVNPVVDPESRTARVTLSLPNPEGRIKPGMYADLSLEALSFPDRVLVPREAVLERDRRTMLFVFEPDPESEGDRGRAKWRYVTTGLENDSLVELVPSEETEMVEPGERVLVGGHQYLVHDARVRAEEARDERPAERGG